MQLRRRGHTARGYVPGSTGALLLLCYCPLADDHTLGLLIGVGAGGDIVSPYPVFGADE